MIFSPRWAHGPCGLYLFLAQEVFGDILCSGCTVCFELFGILERSYDLRGGKCVVAACMQLDSGMKSGFEIMVKRWEIDEHRMRIWWMVY